MLVRGGEMGGIIDRMMGRVMGKLWMRIIVVEEGKGFRFMGR